MIQTAPRQSGLGYLPGIDGIRAVSMLAVLAYHLEASWAAGGYLGVEVFFVVSGYLITGLLLDEHRRTDAVDLRRFWMRRARRLLPAVVALIVTVSVHSAIAHEPGELARFRGDAIASLLYVQNWWAIVADQPYFAVFGRPSPFRHLWSLAIEEQFYLLWPLLLPWSLRRFGRRRTAAILAGLAVCSAMVMAATADITAPERAYYGTDARLFGIVAGALLAFVWRPARARADIGPGPRAAVHVLGLGAAVMLAWQLVGRSEYDSWTYPWGFLIVDLATAVLLVAATHPASALRGPFGWEPLRAIGLRSYSLYLWHWPVIVSTRPGFDWGLDGPTALAARLVILVLLSEASYQLVERPFRDGRAAAWLLHARGAVGRWPLGWRGLARPVGAGAATVAVLVGVLATASDAPAPASVALGAGEATSVTIDTTPLTIPIPETTAPTTTSTPTTTTTIAPAAAAPPTTAAAPTTTVPWPSAPPIADSSRPGRVIDLTVIGESVTLGAAGTLQTHYGDRVQIDAVEGRRFEDGVELIEALAAAGRLTPNVVVHLGNNGIAPPGGLDRIAAAVGPTRRLLLLSVRVPRRWESQVNSEIYRVVQANDHVLLADWRHLANSEPEVLADDGVHLTEHGMVRYVQLIADVVR